MCSLPYSLRITKTWPFSWFNFEYKFTSLFKHKICLFAFTHFFKVSLTFNIFLKENCFDFIIHRLSRAIKGPLNGSGLSFLKNLMAINSRSRNTVRSKLRNVVSGKTLLCRCYWLACWLVSRWRVHVQDDRSAVKKSQSIFGQSTFWELLTSSESLSILTNARCAILNIVLIDSNRLIFSFLFDQLAWICQENDNYG